MSPPTAKAVRPNFRAEPDLAAAHLPEPSLTWGSLFLPFPEPAIEYFAHSHRHRSGYRRFSFLAAACGVPFPFVVNF